MMEKQTIVVKVGTSSLTLSDGTMDAEKIRNITTQLAERAYNNGYSYSISDYHAHH